jgi:hypothetical protein
MAAMFDLDCWYREWVMVILILLPRHTNNVYNWRWQLIYQGSTTCGTQDCNGQWIHYGRTHQLSEKRNAFLQGFTDDEFDGALEKARLLTFDPGDVIIRRAIPGTTFYVLKRANSKILSPRHPSNYLAAVVAMNWKGLIILANEPWRLTSEP